MNQKDTKLIIHGGAGKRPRSKKKISQIIYALEGIISDAYSFLEASTAIEAVVHAVALLEDNLLFNAGTGSRLQIDGKARMTASLMDSRNRIFSAVINIENVKNPIKIANLLQKESSFVLSGREAKRYARKMEYRYYDTVTEERLLEWKKKQNKGNQGTVGAVALDKDGFIAVGSSTGGRGNEIPGRVSDVGSPTGNYVNKCAGVSCTGRGESINNATLAVNIGLRVMIGMNLRDATLMSFKELEELGGKAGIIALDKMGNVFHYHNTDFMSLAYMDKDRMDIMT